MRSFPHEQPRCAIWILTAFSMSTSCAFKADPTAPLPASSAAPVAKTEVAVQPLQTDPATGVPYASTFQYPVSGFSADDFSFCFGGTNDGFPGTAHLGCDTQVSKTPYGAVVVAPGDGIVRITTDFGDGTVYGFGAYGSDNGSNAQYYGCAIVLEHMLPNGQAMTTLIGHVQCERGASYDANAKIGNPLRGTLVRKGQYIGHVNHYWHGSGMSTDWHHTHFGVRRGRFSASTYDRSASLLAYVRGYAPQADFTYDVSAKRYRHPTWIDPIEFVEGHGDPVVAAPVVRHPSGSVLRDPSGAYWQVLNQTDIAQIPADVFSADRYDPAGAVSASSSEIACYSKKDTVRVLGNRTIYQRPGTSTLVIAYDKRGERFDFIRWEAYTSWGFTSADINESFRTAEYYEGTCNPEGYRRLRPGSLVKGNAGSEVAIVSAAQTRIPIASGTVFERLGLAWSRVIELPQSVLDSVAGIRESVTFDDALMTSCAVPPPCPGGGVCGGGGEPEPPESGDLEPLLDGEVKASAPVPLPVPQSQTICTPSSAMTCLCPSSAEAPITGTQTCAPDGLSYEPCACPKIVSDAGTLFDASSSAGGSSALSSIDATPSTRNVGGGGNASISGAGGSDSSAGGRTGAGGSSGIGGAIVNGTGGASPSAPSASLHLVYTSPVCGSLYLEGWWRLADGTTRAWGPISECVDTNISDCTLECDLPVPSGTPYLELQAYTPDHEGYGNEDCYKGGCGFPLGTLRISRGSADVPFMLVPNNAGPPYYNVVLQPVP